jgi:hypothetical protein
MALVASTDGALYSSGTTFLGTLGILINGIAPGSILTEGTRSIFYSPENKQKADAW